MPENIIKYRIDRINDGLTIKQIADGILFGSDALALADFIAADKIGCFDSAAELGAGSGVISLLLAQRKKAERIYAVEIQDAYVSLCRENAAHNGQDSFVKAVKGDIRSPNELYFDEDGEKMRILPHTMSAVFTNPPYMKLNAGLECEKDYKNIARREVLCTISDVCVCACRLLKNKGTFYCVYRPERFAELLYAMRETGITPKIALMIFASSDEASLAVVKGIKGAAEGMKIYRKQL